MSLFLPWMISSRGPAGLGGGGSTTVAHYAADFTGTQGINGWNYGYLTTSGSTSTWTSSGLTYNSVNSRWEGTEAFSTPLLSATAGHPGVSSSTPAAAKWTSTITATIDVKIDGTLGSSAGDVKVQAYKNSTLLGEMALAGTTTPGTTTFSAISIAPGDIIYLVLDPNGSPFNDATSIDLTLTS